MNHYVIIPTYNEHENIDSVLDGIRAVSNDIKIMVVDDNSPDDTASIVETRQETDPNLLLMKRPGKLGLASAYTQSIKKILDDDLDAYSITTMDADLSHDPAVLARMHRYIMDNDLVIGSRYVAGGELKNWPMGRKLLSVFGNLYTRFVSGVPIHDLTAGFQCMRRDFLTDDFFLNIKAEGFAFQMELKTRMYSRGARILEIPIIFENRKHGESKISNHIVYEGFIVPWLLRFRVSRYRSNSSR